MLKYIGGGFLRGVPARDLKDEEVRKFGFSYLVRSGLYVPEKLETKEIPDIEEVKPVRRKNRRPKSDEGE